MSWVTNVVVAEAKEFPFAVEGLKIQGDVTPENHEALEAAKDAIVVLVNSNAVGDESVTYRVSANGHSNPDHKPAEGWSNDSLTISIYQASQQDIEYYERQQQAATQD